ncbi:hypothetical protein [Clostridium sp. D46t1_190503_E9]|uniref:hypothetical protein n=1 Tax=Clostridium sp. D46t1_190503_E9 TaxID=2787137 RepID=UPI00189A1CB5|nr:hypothetical protein [Clostridium sp. D46t1_190503_E9]
MKRSKKLKKEEVKKDKDNISNEVIKFIVTTILASIISTIFVGVYDSYKVNNEQSKISTILYYDMVDSLKMIEFDTGRGVFKNQLTFIEEDKFYDYLIAIRGKVSEKDFENIKVYYRNLFYLEDVRKKYWEGEDENTIIQLEKEYNELKCSLENEYKEDKPDFIQTIEELKHLGNVKN